MTQWWRTGKSVSIILNFFLIDCSVHCILNHVLTFSGSNNLLVATCLLLFISLMNALVNRMLASKLLNARLSSFFIKGSFNSTFFNQFTEEDQWQTVARTDQGPMREYSVSYQNLMPSSSYTFRIVAYNKFGISYPVYTHDPVSLCFFLTNVSSFSVNWIP